MPKTYSVATDLTLHHVVDSSVKVVLLPTVFLRESFGVSATTAVGNADGVANVIAHPPVVATGAGHADGLASVSAQSLVAFVVGNADGSADVIGWPQTVSNQTGNADGLGTALGGVKIPGDGCALIVGI